MKRCFSVLAVLLLLLPVSGCADDDDEDANKPIEITPSTALPHPDPATAPAIDPAIAYDGVRVHMVYCQDDGGGVFDLMYTQRIGSGAWAAPAPVYPGSAGDSLNPHVFLDADEKLHIVWEEDTAPNREIRYATRDSTGVISSAVNLSSGSADDVANPRVHVDAAGRVHFVWQTASFIIYRQRQLGGVFTTPKELSEQGEIVERPDVTTDDGNLIYVVWSETVSSSRDIRLVRSDDNGIMFGPVGATGGYAAAGAVDMTQPRIRGGILGEVFLCFVGQDSQGERGLFASYTRTGGTFVPPTLLAFSESGGVRDPEMAVFRRSNDEFTLAVIYNDGADSGGNVLVRTSPNSGSSWPGDAVNLSEGSSQPVSNRRPFVALNGSHIAAAWDGQPIGGGTVRTWGSTSVYTLP